MTSSTTKRAAIYARVSTSHNGQDPEVQLRELRTYVEKRGWRLAGEYVDHGVSGSKQSRPALDALLKTARQRKVDVIAAWSLDRMGRSLRHLVLLVDELRALGVDLAIYSQPIDTTSPAGALTFAVLGAVAEFEREMIRTRVRAGIANARAQGTRLGRPPAAVDVDQVHALRAAGLSLRQIATRVGASKTAVGRLLAQHVG